MLGKADTDFCRTFSCNSLHFVVVLAWALLLGVYNESLCGTNTTTLAKPATSTWCQGPVPSPRGSQEPATVPRVRLKALGVGRRVWGSAVFGRPETQRRLELLHSYASLRVAPSLALRIHFCRPACKKVYREKHHFESHECLLTTVPAVEEIPTVQFADAERQRYQCPYCVNSYVPHCFPQRLARIYPDRPEPKLPENPSKVNAITLEVDPTTNRLYCPYCESTHHVRWALRHVRAHHPGKPGPLLPSRFVSSRRCRSPPRKESESDDANAVLDAGRKRCPFCDKSYAYTWLNRHIRSAHPNEQLPEIEPRSAPPKRRRLQSEQSIWPCDECELQFFSKDALRAHKQAKHNDDAPTPPQTDASTHRFRCDACDKTYASRTGLTYHVQRQHPTHGVGVEIKDGQKEKTIAIVTKTLKCPLCPASLATEDTLCAHLWKINGLHEMKKNHQSWLKSHVCEETPAHLLPRPGLEALRTSTAYPRWKNQQYSSARKSRRCCASYSSSTTPAPHLLKQSLRHRLWRVIEALVYCFLVS